MNAAQRYLQGDFDTRHVGDTADARRQRVLVAGALNDRKVLNELGCMEQSTWWDGRYLASKGAEKNPYRMGAR